MPTLVRPQDLSLSSTGALGDGGSQTLAVRVDGSTITINGSNQLVAAGGGGGGSGTVTSVALSLPSTIIAVTGSPVTTSGTLTGTFHTQTSTTFFAGPSTGAAAIPTFRTISSTDLPALPYQASGNYVSTSRLISTLAPLAGGGDLSADRTLSMPVAGASANGYLSSTDWTTFNNKTSNIGTVTSVALALPSTVFTVSGSPVTTTGTLTGVFATQTSTLIFAGPASGAAAAPTFRAMSSTDVPILPYVFSSTTVLSRGFTYSVDARPSVLSSTNSSTLVVVPINCTIVSYTILADVSGSVVVTVQKGSYAGYPAVSDITGGANVVLSSAIKNTDSVLSGWSPSLSAGDNLVFGISGSPSVVRQIVVNLKVMVI